MRKTNLFAVAVVLFVGGAGGWAASYTQARVIGPMDGGIRINPFQITLNAQQLPTQQFQDFSVLD